MASSDFNPKALELFNLIRRTHNRLGADDIRFLMNWLKVVDSNEFELGFKGAKGLQEQLDEALPFYQGIQRKWQEDTLQHKTNLGFLDYFETEAIVTGVELPNYFASQMKQMEELL